MCILNSSMNNNSCSIFLSIFFPLSTLLSDNVLLDPPFEFHHDSTTIDISSDSVGSFNGMIHNTSSDVVNLAVVRRLNVIEEGWTSSICVAAICYNEMIDSVSFEMNAGDSIPCGVLVWVNESGVGTVQLDIFDLNGQSEHVLVDIIFYFNETVSTITDVAGQEGPKSFNLMDNYPNPFNPFTTLRYEILKDEKVEITVYDMSGRVVRKLLNNVQKAGQNHVQWNGLNDQGMTVSSGSYLYNIQAGGHGETRKMVLLR